MVRDQALALAGLLSRKMRGPSVYPPQPPGLWRAAFNGRDRKWPTSTGADRYRRGLYTFWRRTVPYPSMATFDAPSREACVVGRSRSNTPLQALTLLNDPVYLEAARSLAERMATEPPANASIEDRAAHGFRLATGRRPQSHEVDILLDRFEHERFRLENDLPQAKQLIADWQPPETVDIAEFAAWIHVGNVLLNLDEVVTK